MENLRIIRQLFVSYVATRETNTFLFMSNGSNFVALYWYSLSIAYTKSIYLPNHASLFLIYTI